MNRTMNKDRLSVSTPRDCYVHVADVIVSLEGVNHVNPWVIIL